jgi:hypothetical protein
MTYEEVRALFDYDAARGCLTWKSRRHKAKAGDRAGSLHKPTGYVHVHTLGRVHKVHRLIYLWHHGSLPEFIDHIDHDRSNNRIENLRPATRKENQANRVKRKRPTASIWKGVYWSHTSKKWAAQIRIADKLTYLGVFAQECDAAQAYNFMAWEHFGDYAALNVWRDGKAHVQ